MDTKIMTDDEKFDALLNGQDSALLLNEMAESAKTEEDFPMPGQPHDPIYDLSTPKNATEFDDNHGKNQ